MARVRMSALLTGLLAAGVFANPLRPLPVDLCLLKTFTGWACPTCGLTRAVCHALQGEWAASLGFHPAGILVAASLVGWTAWTSLEAVRGRALWLRAQRPVAKFAGAAIALTSLLGWIAR
jgi:hypothetical protein